MFHIRFLKSPTLIRLNKNNNSNNIISKNINGTKKYTKGNNSLKRKPEGNIIKNSSTTTNLNYTYCLKSIISIVTDLGDSFFYGNLTLKITTILHDNNYNAYDNDNDDNGKTRLINYHPVLPCDFKSFPIINESNIQWEIGNRDILYQIEITSLQIKHAIQHLNNNNKFKSKSSSINDNFFISVSVEVINSNEVIDELNPVNYNNTDKHVEDNHDYEVLKHPNTNRILQSQDNPCNSSFTCRSPCGVINSKQKFKSSKVEKIIIPKIEFLTLYSLPLLLFKHNNVAIDDIRSSEKFSLRKIKIGQDIDSNLNFNLNLNSNSNQNIPADVVRQKELIILEESNHDIARHLWDGGLIVSKYILTLFIPCIIKQNHHHNNINILELGSGTGLLGISISKLLPNSNVLLTDLPDAKDLSNYNINLNNMNTYDDSNNLKKIEFQTYIWNDKHFPVPNKNWNPKNTNEKFWKMISTENIDSISPGEFWDLIILSDCSYNSTYYEPLLQTLHQLSQLSTKTKILLGHKFRSKFGEPAFFQQLFGHKEINTINKRINLFENEILEDQYQTSYKNMEHFRLIDDYWIYHRQDTTRVCLFNKQQVIYEL